MPLRPNGPQNSYFLERDFGGVKAPVLFCFVYDNFAQLPLQDREKYLLESRRASRFEFIRSGGELPIMRKILLGCDYFLPVGHRRSSSSNQLRTMFSRVTSIGFVSHSWGIRNRRPSGVIS